jgi:hypothetical protein
VGSCEGACGEGRGRTTLGLLGLTLMRWVVMWLRDDGDDDDDHDDDDEGKARVLDVDQIISCPGDLPWWGLDLAPWWAPSSDTPWVAARGPASDGIGVFTGRSGVTKSQKQTKLVTRMVVMVVAVLLVIGR